MIICEWYWHFGAILFYILVALVVNLIKTPKINHIIGYSTRRSMLNQNTWDEANDFSEKVFWIISIEMALQYFILYLMFDYCKLSALFTLFAVKSLLVFPITEYQLKSVFSKKGENIK